MFMSASTFRRHFLQQTGMSFSAWRQRACVVSALAMLITGKPVNEVALSLGYDNGSSFATMFRRVTGQPPSFYHPA
jgi:AraC-like DNA-binding protein